MPLWDPKQPWEINVQSKDCEIGGMIRKVALVITEMKNLKKENSTKIERWIYSM